MSPRFAPGVMVLALLALVPTVVHNYLGLKADAGARVADVVVAPPGMASEATARRASWFKESFESDDAFERVYRDGAGASIKLTVIRSYNAKLLFHHPENFVAYGQALHDHDIVAVTGLPGVPVHRLRPEGVQRDARRALYVLSYRDTFVEDPVRFQVGLAWSLLFSGREPMTLVFVQSSNRLSVARDVDGQVLRAALEALGLVSQPGGQRHLGAAPDAR